MQNKIAKCVAFLVRGPAGCSGYHRYIRPWQLFDYVPTRTTVPNGLVKELQEIEPLALPQRDVRASKPLLGGLLRFDVARAVIRITTLAALDLAGLLAAIYTALIVK